jgi:hypothetical protein
MSSHESGKHKGSRDPLNQASMCPTAWGVEGAPIKQPRGGKADVHLQEGGCQHEQDKAKKKKQTQTMSYDGAQRWRQDRPPHSCLQARGGHCAPGRGRGRASARTCEKQKKDKPGTKTKTKTRNPNQRRQEAAGERRPSSSPASEASEGERGRTRANERDKGRGRTGEGGA